MVFISNLFWILARDRQELTVKADGRIVWQGMLVPVVLEFQGPVGLRSDNAHVVSDFLVGGP